MTQLILIQVRVTATEATWIRIDKRRDMGVERAD
jgi:hypothetical protein